jgi:hypothetical protein
MHGSIAALINETLREDVGAYAENAWPREAMYSFGNRSEAGGLFLPRCNSRPIATRPGDRQKVLATSSASDFD